MTPKEKAKQIQGKFNLLFASKNEWISNTGINKSTKCAIVAVSIVMDNLLGKENCFVCGKPVGDYKYWNEVKIELEKM